MALFISLFPAAMAAETEKTTSSLVSEGSVLETQEEMQTTELEITEPPTESPPGETAPEETTAPDTEPTVPSETAPENSPEMDAPMDFPEDMDTFSIGSTQGSIMLFDYADNGNYTTVLNSQVSCAYKPNGSGTTRTAYIKNLGWHFARYGGVAYPDDPLYCIEPWRNYGASTSGNSVDRDVTLSGSGSTSGSNVWYAMPTARREAIGLILLYSDQMWDHSISVTTTRKDSNPNVPLRIATQFLIYEIVCGLRDPSTFERNYENECGTSGDVFYNAGKSSVSGFSSNYNTLVSNIQAAKKIPSFTSSSMGNAPTITLNGTSTSATDTNGVLSYFSFPNGSGASFSKSGSTLKITQTGTISESTVFKATRYLPSASGSTYNLWYMSGSSYQTTISLCNASSGNLNAYFKLKAPSMAGLALTKTTEDGKNLSGWRFGIYSNSACTSLVSGPHTTDSSGKISVTGLSAGTYYVKELGHTDSSINTLYTCSGNNPQKVTLTAGQTASVSFHNVLAMGRIEFRNAGKDGESVMTIEMTEAGLSEINTSKAVYTGEDMTNSGYSDCTLRITYTAKMNSDASVNYGEAGNPNDVVLTWKRTSQDYYDTLVDDCHLYTFGIDLTKRFSDGKGDFSKVEFMVQNKTDGYFVKAELNQDEGVYYVVDHVADKADATHFVPVTSGENPGKVMIKGLEDDTYIMTEVRTDNGYVLLKKGIEVVIAQKESDKLCDIYASDVLGLIQNDPRYAEIIQDTGDLHNMPQKHLEHKLLTASATVDSKKVNMVEDNGSKDAEAPLTVVNTRGFDLPKTGDNGTMMFTVVGILLMAGAAAVLVVANRKKKSV